MAAGNYFSRKRKNRDGFAWCTLFLFGFLSTKGYNEAMTGVEAASYGFVVFLSIFFVAYEEKHPGEAELNTDEGGAGTDE